MAPLATIATLLLSLGGGDEVTETPPGVREPGRAAKVLRESLQEPHPVLDELTERLGSLPPDEVPGMFAILEHGTVPDSAGESLAVDPWRLEALLGAFARVSPTAVRKHLRGLAAQATAESTRETAVLVLGEMGTRQDALLLVRVAAPADRARPVGRALQQAVTDALARMIVRDEQTIWTLREVYDQCHEGLLATVPRAVRAAQPPEGLQILAELLGRAPAADALILAELGHFGESVGVAIDPMVREEVRAYLGRADAHLVQGAALAAHKLDDTDAVRDLVRLMRHHDENVRRTADLALRRITGRDFRGDAERWEVWYAEQLHWFATSARELIDDLDLGEKALVARALNELATRRIFRDELAAPVIDVLRNPDTGLAVVACSVIGKLGLRSAAPELIELAEHANPTLKGAAQGALTRLRGPGGRAGRLTVKR
jgi:HEAT repeat protein